MNRPLSRRHFLSLVGAAGGSTAILQTSLALGLLPETGPLALADVQHAENTGKGNSRILILGAGISGLAVAYELERKGYDCTVIEASHRIGGRNLTLRSGDRIDEMGYSQVCEFDDEPHLYFNAGPARIPGHHKLVLHYCREFRIPLETYVNDNRNAYTQDDNAFDGKPVRIREYITDARGFMSELLYKAVDRDVFEQPLSAEDKERILAFATAYGDLKPDGSYAGSDRAGYKAGGFVEHGELKEMHQFSDLLKSDFWRYRMHFTEGEDQAMPVMQPVGGMDMIVRAFGRNIRSPIHTNAQVQSIQLRADGADVIYNHNGRRKKISGDWCFNCIPHHLLSGIYNNFSKEYSQALAAVERGHLLKIGLQMKQRFWEADNIYGGISWTGQPIEQIWYPTHGIHAEKGVMLGAYTFREEHAQFFERMTPEERIRSAIAQGEKIHPGYGSYVDSGVSVPWARMNHQMGCNARWSPDLRDSKFKLLQQADGRHYIMGDQISYHSGWQEGAFASAHFAMADMNERILAESAGATATG
ncbi:MAG TPA: FAD-dependent oxidoreductase [Woeseiaceae bacterium]|nr:FAD-dependent oxidoreductase [Woeseiaceae bacterium]